ncbi:hypothetical protein L6164_010173 [Bauhinia variegata]|uniref:Uncharacterized protein n=1 Tax=Bauhinia variegata TaxID=167791 RepID=A0ACB9PNG9_BAUVA|nr:hypothetical protein L6164_010173 [Bauhinia variegata]
MPFPLSLCLTLSAIFWFCYGFFTKDFFVAMPNTPGILFGATQIVLYFIYRNGRRHEDANGREMQNIAARENMYMVAEGIVRYVNYSADEEHERAENANTEPRHVENENHFHLDILHVITVNAASSEGEIPTVTVEEEAAAPTV